MKKFKDNMFHIVAVVSAVLYIISIRYVGLENYEFATISAMLLSALLSWGYLVERYSK